MKRTMTLVCAGALFAFPATAQHETAADIQEGARVFRNNCANCHGPDGDQIAGIDLGRGQFRRELSDADLVEIILKGIAGTPMPPTNMSREQAQRVVAYLRSTAEAARKSPFIPGDAARGRAIFEGKGGCIACHRVQGAGGRLGPDLTAIGRQRRAVELQQALLDPQAEVAPSNRFYRIVTKDGSTVTGRLLNHDTFTVQILDQTERLRSFQKTDLREHGFAPTPMPSYRGKLTPEELADVVTYLVSLKGRTTS